MELEKKECIHIVEVLQQAKTALKNKIPMQLRDLSDKTIHSSCTYQESGSITIAVILYTLSKLIEREDHLKIEKWASFEKKFDLILDNAIASLKENNQDKYRKYIQEAREAIEAQSVNIKPYIQEVLKKASINRGSRIYEHGISLAQTSQLLGISQWELADYIGQRTPKDEKQTLTIDTKKRARMALEFFT